ncbi:hypothetical protein [Saccharopolyspora halophila]
MGIFSRAEADTAQSDAQQAWDAGDDIHVVEIRPRTKRINDRSRPLPDVARALESIESVGWQLDRHTFVGTNATLCAIFRRP